MSLSLIKPQTSEINFRVSKTLYMFKNHNNVETEYRHATKMVFIPIYIFKCLTPTSALLAISSVCERMLHTL